MVTGHGHWKIMIILWHFAVFPCSQAPRTSQDSQDRRKNGHGHGPLRCGQRRPRRFHWSLTSAAQLKITEFLMMCLSENRVAHGSPKIRWIMMDHDGSWWIIILPILEWPQIGWWWLWCYSPLSDRPNQTFCYCRSKKMTLLSIPIDIPLQ